MLPLSTIFSKTQNTYLPAKVIHIVVVVVGFDSSEKWMEIFWNISLLEQFDKKVERSAHSIRCHSTTCLGYYRVVAIVCSAFAHKIRGTSQVVRSTVNNNNNNKMGHHQLEIFLEARQVKWVLLNYNFWKNFQTFSLSNVILQNCYETGNCYILQITSCWLNRGKS